MGALVFLCLITRSVFFISHPCKKIKLGFRNQESRKYNQKSASLALPFVFPELSVLQTEVLNCGAPQLFALNSQKWRRKLGFLTKTLALQSRDPARCRQQAKNNRTNSQGEQ